MDAVAALCHFCEVHGPSIVLTTQPFHATVPHGVPGTAPNGPWGLGTVESETSTWSNPWFTTDGPFSAEGLSTGPNDLPPGGNSKAPTGKRPPSVSRRDSCDACKAFQTSQQIFYSHDETSGVTYISSQAPENPKVFSMLRQACVRSLSCEVCPGREGPIFFGHNDPDKLDAGGGNVLTYTFYVKDSLSRGFQRFYSIVVLMSDKIFLLNSWPFIVENVKAIVEKIQESAAIVYGLEQTDNPQRGARLTQSFLRGGAVGPGNKAPRSLAELTANKYIYKLLHMQFTWLLRTGAGRLKEKILEGAPLQEGASSLDAGGLEDDDDEDYFLVADLAEEVSEEGFVKVGPLRSSSRLPIAAISRPSKELVTESPTMTPTDVKTAAEKKDASPVKFSLNDSDSSSEERLVPPSENRHHLPSKYLKSFDAFDEAGRVALNDDADEDSIDFKIFGHLRDVVKIVGEERFHSIAHHVLVGDQVIVQGQPRHLVTGLLQVLRTLIPAGCSKTIPYSFVYEDAWKCNFIGLAPEVTLPSYVVESETPPNFLWLGVASATVSSAATSSSPFIVESALIPIVEVVVLKSAPPPPKPPEILRRMELALFNANLSNSMVDQCLLCLREEWMNKAKALFAFTRAGATNASETDKLLKVLGTEPQDKHILMFWMTGLSSQFKQHVFGSLNGAT